MLFIASLHNIPSSPPPDFFHAGLYSPLILPDNGYKESRQYFAFKVHKEHLIVSMKPRLQNQECHLHESKIGESEHIC